MIKFPHDYLSLSPPTLTVEGTAQNHIGSDSI